MVSCSMLISVESETGSHWHWQCFYFEGVTWLLLVNWNLLRLFDWWNNCLGLLLRSLHNSIAALTCDCSTCFLFFNFLIRLSLINHTAQFSGAGASLRNLEIWIKCWRFTGTNYKKNYKILTCSIKKIRLRYEVVLCRLIEFYQVVYNIS